MALDVLLGNGKAHLSNSVTVTTTNAVAAGSIIVYTAAAFAPGNTMSPPGAGLTWTLVNSAAPGNLRMYQWWAHAPSGLASSTALTATTSGGSNDLMATALALSGRNTSSPVSSFNSASNTTNAWDVGTLTATLGDDLVGVAFQDGDGASTSTPTDGTEFADFNDATQNEGMAGHYLLNATGGSNVLDGTFTAASAISWVGVGGAFKAGAAGGTSVMAPAFNAIPFIGGIS